MHTTLNPLPTTLLLSTAARLNFRAISRDRSGATLGVLVNASGAQQHLVIASDGADGTWTLCGALLKGQKPFLLYESAANVLRGGKLNDDGSISYQGELYSIESSFDGNLWTAKVSDSA